MAAGFVAALNERVLVFDGALGTMPLGGFLGVLFFGLLWLFGFSETDKEFLGTFWNVAQRALPKRFKKGNQQ